MSRTTNVTVPEEAFQRCATSGCRGEGVKDVLVPAVIDKQVAIVEDYWEGQKWTVRAVVSHAKGPMVVKKVLQSMCADHAKYWEPAPEV